MKPGRMISLVLRNNLRTTTEAAPAPHPRSRLLLRVEQKVPYCEYFEHDTSRFHDFSHLLCF